MSVNYEINENMTRSSMCSEVFTDTLKGYPKYETGFELVGCENIESLYVQVTILFNFVNNADYLTHTFGNNKGKLF